MQNPSHTCPQCQSPIPADAPGGLCPACVLLGVAGPTNPSQFAAAAAPTIEEIAAAFPELEVLEIIGQGGMGVVFKVRQPRLDRLVALKILPPALAAQPGFSERFTREARVLARLAHPHIVAIYDFGESAGFFYLIMEFVNGVNLRAAMRAGVKPEQALLLVPHICEALQFAHDHGVLHRDIKPENILLDTAGTPKLADFGIAKLAGEESMKTGLTATGAALGTAAYMAPEQVERPATVDHRADIYSLGVVLYEMLTGELPLGRFGVPSEKSTVSRGVDEVVMRALEKERDRRQQSAIAMKTEVERATQSGAQRKVVGPAVNPWPRRIFFLILTLVLVPTLLIVAGLVVPYLAMRREPSATVTVADVVTATRAPFIAHLPEGTVELIAIAPHPSDGQAWWRMDGVAATEGPFHNSGTNAFPQAGQRAWEFIIRVRDLPAESSGPFWQVDDCAGWSGGSSPSLASNPGVPLAGHYLVAASLPRSLGQTNVRAGFASGPWQTLYESNPRNPSGVSLKRDGETWDIAAGSAIETKDGDTVVTFSSGRHLSFETRVAALLADGQLVAGSGSTMNGQSEWRFRGTPRASIKTFHLQKRPIRWVEFRGVQLAPAPLEK